MTTTENATYDEAPYESVSIDLTLPRWIAAAERVFGLNPAPVERCRLLEIGCSTGGNLVAIAMNFPDSELLEIVFSAVQIAGAQKTVDQLCLNLCA